MAFNRQLNISKFNDASLYDIESQKLLIKEETKYEKYNRYMGKARKAIISVVLLLCVAFGLFMVMNEDVSRNLAGDPDAINLKQQVPEPIVPEAHKLKQEPITAQSEVHQVHQKRQEDTPMPTTGGDSVSLPPQPTEPVPQKLAKPVPQKDVKHHKQVPQVHKVHQKHTPMPTTGGDKWSMPPQNEGGLQQGPPVEQVVKPMGGDANGAEQKKVADVQLEVKHAATQVKLEKLAVVKEHKHKQVVNAQMALTEANKLVETAAKRLQKAHQEHIEIQHREVLETFHKHLLEDLKETNNEITDTKNAMSDLELKIKQAKIIKN